MCCVVFVAVSGTGEGRDGGSKNEENGGCHAAAVVHINDVVVVVVEEEAVLTRDQDRGSAQHGTRVIDRPRPREEEEEEEEEAVFIRGVNRRR